MTRRRPGCARAVRRAAGSSRVANEQVVGEARTGKLSQPVLHLVPQEPVRHPCVVEPLQVPEVLMAVDDHLARGRAVSFQTSPSGNPYLVKLSSYIATQYPGDVASL